MVDRQQPVIIFFLRRLLEVKGRTGDVLWARLYSCAVENAEQGARTHVATSQLIQKVSQHSASPCFLNALLLQLNLAACFGDDVIAKSITLGRECRPCDRKERDNSYCLWGANERC